MSENPLDKKYEQATQVVCSQGMIPFPVNDTTVSILKNVIEDDEEELDFICAFRQNSSQTKEQLIESSKLSVEKIERLATGLARKGLIFNQPSSTGIMVYRLLPLMTVGLMEYKFMGELTGDEKERELAELFGKLIVDVRDQVQKNYDDMVPMFEMSPPVDRTVPTLTMEDGKNIKTIPIDKSI